jgi:hypothetical protein
MLATSTWKIGARRVVTPCRTGSCPVTRAALVLQDSASDTSQLRLETQLRLDGVRLAARTLEHHTRNDLTVMVGYADLIVEDRELPERFRDMARLVHDSALAVVENVRRLSQVRSIRLVESGAPGGPLLDLGSPSEELPNPPKRHSLTDRVGRHHLQLEA